MMSYKQYEPHELRQLQLISTMILGEFDRICQKLNIDYYVYGGTAIGTVRHKGFVPWDDDVDIALFREDYERFMREAPQEMGEAYELVSGRTDPFFPACNANFSLKNTFCVPEEFAHCPFQYPIGIGLFAMDKPSNDPRTLERQRRMTWFFARLAFLRATPAPHVQLSQPLKGLVLVACYLAHWAMKIFHVSPRWIHARWEHYARLAEHEQGETYVDFMDRDPHAWAVTRAEAYPAIRAPFETITVNLPKAYDVMLRRGFGDYMQLPPENDRKNHYPSRLDFGPYKDIKE
nr:LicD family protein [Fannyhessea vaginae]